jgi:transposase
LNVAQTLFAYETSSYDAVYSLAMAPERDSLPNDVEQMKDLYIQLWMAMESSEHEKQRLVDQLRKHLRARFGRKAEAMDAKQLMLAFAEMQNSGVVPPETAEPEKPQAAAARRIEKASHGRRALPADLPRVEIVHDIPDAEKTCACGKKMISLPPEVSEQLDYVPSKLRVIRHIRPKYLCAGPHENESPRFVTRELPLQPIARGLAAPGLLAYLMVSKYDDHLPLYRLEEIFARQQIDLPRSTLCEWVQACAELCVLLYDEFKRRVLLSLVINADDTNVPTQRREIAANPCGDLDGETNTKALRQTLGKGYIWVYAGDAANPYTVFDFTPDRSRDGPRLFLGKYRGYLQGDAYSGYDVLYERDSEGRRHIYEVGCWAHARRYFYDARSSGGHDAIEALAMIARLYHVERDAKELKLEGRALSAFRRMHAMPVLKAFRSWLDKRIDARTGILPKSALGEAITYASRNFRALTRYTMRGYLSIDNNAAERALKNVVIGRKNFLFCGSDRGGRSAAVIYTLIESAKRCGANPYEYLRDVLARLPQTRLSEIPQLLPEVLVRARTG